MNRPTLHARAQGRDNNFNLMRFLAASVVLFTHSFALALGSSEAEPLKLSLGMTLGSMAVDLFFVSSGFLIAASFFSGKGLVYFVSARVLRIYPALIVATVFTVFGLGLIFTELSKGAYLTDTQTYRFLIKNSILIKGVEFELPGVFLHTPYEKAVNGSLWTLPYEVKMYSYLALVGLVVIGLKANFPRFPRAKVTLLGLAVLGFAANLVNHFRPFHDPFLSHLFAMFFAGAAFYAWRDRVVLSTKLAFVLLTVIVAAALIHREVFFVLYCAALPYLVLYLAYVPKGKIRGFNRFGDYSYGLYIYAFPVQQAIAASMPGIGVPLMVILSFAITFVLAWASWHLVEKRFLSLKAGHLWISHQLDGVLSRLPERVHGIARKFLRPVTQDAG